MSGKHTKGPWVDAPAGRNMADNYAQPYAVASNGGHNLVAGCFGDGAGGRDAAEANAHLIAAAPELLEALEKLQAVLRVGILNSDVADVADAFDSMHAALAKAKGGAS